MYTISKAGIADVSELNILVNSAYRGDRAKKGWTNEAHLLTGARINEEELTRMIGIASSFFLKYSENEVLKACMFLEKHEDKLYLGLLSVNPDFQGKGIGKKLLKAAEAEAQNLACSKIYMTVISVRHELIDWYKRHGYVDTGIKKPFPGQNRNILVKTLLQFVVLEKNIVLGQKE